MPVADNIQRIYGEIDAVCAACGRKTEEIQLMAVSKFQPAQAVDEAYRSGLRLFGESRVQEASVKFAVKSYAGMKLHMIGALQRNKVKQALAVFDCVQSVDRHELIAELGKQVSLRDTPLEILFELHSGEETKTGYKGVEALFNAVEAALDIPALRIKGLMTMAPLQGDEKTTRASFRRLKDAAGTLSSRYPEADFSVLSMGMSGDFKTAIEEGSTLLRIGSAIFGERQ